MEYVQERVSTLHGLTDHVPDAPLDRTAVIVPMTHREHGSVAAERTLSTLADLEPATVVIPLRAPQTQLGRVRSWFDGFDLPVTLLWCNAPAVERLLDEHGLDGESGKGSDVWLALGVAARDCEYVVCHDADATTYSPAHVPKLVAPLTSGFSFTKGYYARVEDGALYGRLFRLFYEPLLRALEDATDEPIVDYFGAFRYALAGEFGMTRALARQLRPPRTWGLEVATLGDAYRHAGFDGSAQVDLGRHEHEHRSVDGPGGLETMSREVGDALFSALEDGGVTPDYETLPDRYRSAAERLIDAYAADAAFNGLQYDRERERDQVDAYASAIGPPDEDDRLPPWADAVISPQDVVRAAQSSLVAVSED